MNFSHSNLTSIYSPLTAPLKTESKRLNYLSHCEVIPIYSSSYIHHKERRSVNDSWQQKLQQEKWPPITPALFHKRKRISEARAACETRLHFLAKDTRRSFDLDVCVYADLWEGPLSASYKLLRVDHKLSLRRACCLFSLALEKTNYLPAANELESSGCGRDSRIVKLMMTMSLR